MIILPQYEPIFHFKGRYIFLLSGAGTGKSFVMAQRIISDLLSMENCYWLCTRKLHTDVGRSVFEQIKDVVWKFGLEKFFHINKSNRIIQCKLNNSKVAFTGIDDPSKIKSIAETTHIFMEEADEMEEEDFDILDTRCRSLNAPFNQMVLAFNPPEKTHWIPTRFFRGGEILPDYNKYIEWSDIIDNIELKHLALRTHYKDNPYLPADSKARYEHFKEHNYAYYERYCLGTWMSNAEGNYFKPEHTIYGSQLGRNIIYIDPAWGQIENKNDYNCILKTSFINNQFHINDCILKQAITPNEMMESVYNLVDKNTKHIYYDAKHGQRNHMNSLRANAKIQLPMIEDYTNVDKHTPEVMTEWINRNIIFPRNFNDTKTGIEALKQLYNFAGKTHKSKIHDDFPDALICSVHLINEKIRKSNFLKGWLK